MAVSLLAYGLAYDTTVNVNTTGVSPSGVFLEVTAPASMNFLFDFTRPGSAREIDRANWAAFQYIVAMNAPMDLLASDNPTDYRIVVISNVPYQLVAGVPSVTGTGFPLDRYTLTIKPPRSDGVPQSKRLSDITAPWVAFTGNPGEKEYSIQVSVRVLPTDVPSGFNQSIVIPLSVIPTP